jgi:hypothetical protein
MIAEHVFRSNDSPLVVTSLNDAKHSNGSLHYRGRGADLRIWYLADPRACADALRDALHDDFDVVLEKTHIHLEYDPQENKE